MNVTRIPVTPPESDKDPIWGIYKTYPIIGQNNDGTIYHYQWQKIIDALNLLLTYSTNSGLPNGSTLNIKEAYVSYNMSTDDTVLLVKQSTPITITLPTDLTAQDVGRIYYIKDSLGNSEQYPITIVPAPHYIDSPQLSINPNPDLENGKFIIEENYAAVSFIWVGTFWHVL